jgi:serine/threonine protein kinase
MSPEALAGESPRPSFDLWSLSFVLYESLAGRHPFADLSPQDVVTALRRSAIPDIRDVCPECPASLAGFFHDSLSPVPARRPVSAAALRRVLQTLQTQTGRR